MKIYRTFGLFLTILCLLHTCPACAQEGVTELQLRKQIKTSKSHALSYPKSTRRFYQANGNQLVWIKPEEKAGNTFQAMLLLDCVVQYGLSHADYHPEMLTYEKLHVMINQPQNSTAEEKAAFDIMLTDAMISLMNHLHYGKLNPLLHRSKIDQGKNLKMRADLELQKVIKRKDITAGITGLQPDSKAYQSLQSYLKLVRGQYVGDCYEIPEAEARLAAVNMERIRWRTSTAFLDKPLPAKYTYLTCEIRDGLPLIRKDIYQQDRDLQTALFGNKVPKN